MIRIDRRILQHILKIIVFLAVTGLLIVFGMYNMTSQVLANELSSNKNLANQMVSNGAAQTSVKPEPGMYIFVSFSMKDEALRAYFKEAQIYGATLVMRGFVDKSSDAATMNRFAATKNRIEKARINVQINPNLFEQINVLKVPVIAVVDDMGNIKKISGHITLQKALEYMDVKGQTQQTLRKHQDTNQVVI